MGKTNIFLDRMGPHINMYCMWSLVRPVLLRDEIFEKKIRLVIRYKKKFPTVYCSICFLKLDSRFS